ncbi:MAG: uroporphyrinogen decarboxylase family protein [bacterium]
MTPKQRIIETVRHNKTDIPAMYIGFSPDWEKKLAKALNVSRNDLHPALGNDIIPVDIGINAYMMEDMPEGEVRQSEFGFTYNKIGETFNIVDFPIKSIDDVADYIHPDPNAPGRYDLLDTQVKKFGNDYPILVDISPVAFEAAYSLMGIEETMIALAMEPETLKHLFEKHVAYTLAVAKHSIDHGTDIIWTGDDWGTQQGMLISPEMWRSEIKPIINKLWNGIKEYKSDVIIAHHSCGAIAPIIPDLVEMGLDILNPIQPNVPGMDPATLAEKFKRKITFLGGIDTQDLLCNASPDEVENSVKNTMATFGTGYILSPAHRIHDVPFANIQALFRVAGRDTIEGMVV